VPWWGLSLAGTRSLVFATEEMRRFLHRREAKVKTYTFHVSLPGMGRVWRKLELRADQTLEALHFAIQDAFCFDADHLYSFYMSGKAWDRSTEYCLPEGADPWGMVWSDEEDDADEGDADETDTDEDADPTFEEYRDGLLTLVDSSKFTDEDWRAFDAGARQLYQDFVVDLPGDVRTTRLQDLDLQVGQTFLYLFDYGDEWRFRVRVHAVNPDAPEAKYPRVVESVGEAPPQYRDFGE